MWSLKFLSSFRHRIVLPGLMLGLSLALSGCLQPLYMASGSNDVAHNLQQIAIAPVPDRLGHYIETELTFLLNGTGDTVPAKYRLTVETKETNQTLAIDSQTSRADSASIFVTAQFKLVNIEGGKEIASGQVSSAAPYDRSVQRFANLRAVRDSEIRVAKSLANDIKNRIAAILATQSGS